LAPLEMVLHTVNGAAHGVGGHPPAWYRGATARPEAAPYKNNAVESTPTSSRTK
jgi:hypothetical protein